MTPKVSVAAETSSRLRGLRLDVVAEGVETAEQPLPAAELKAFLREWPARRSIVPRHRVIDVVPE